MKKDLPDREHAWYLQAIDESKHARLPAAVAKLYAGLTMGLQFMVDYGVLSKKEAQKLAAEGWECFLTWTSEQAERVERQRAGMKFIEGLIALMNSGQVSFGNVDDDMPKALTPGQAQIGWRDKEGDYLLNPIPAYAAVRRLLNNTDEPLTFKEPAVWNDLEALGFTECAQGRKKFQCRIYGKRMRVIKIRKERIDDAINSDEDNGIQTILPDVG